MQTLQLEIYRWVAGLYSLCIKPRNQNYFEFKMLFRFLYFFLDLSHVSFDNHAMEDIKVFVTSPDHDVNDHPMAQTSFIVEGINDNHEDNNE